MIRTCIIGISSFGAVHYRDLMREVERGRMEAVGATVINQDEEPDKCAALRSAGCHIFDDYRAMLDALGGRCDLCMIPTGIACHAPMTIDALKAGKNVLVEKPAAATIQDVKAMQAAERESGRFVAVGYQNIYDPQAHALKDALLAGSVGGLREIRVWNWWPRSKAYYARNNWAGRRRSDDGAWVLDSPINNAVAHYLNLACFFVGSTFEQTACPAAVTAELYRAHVIESFDTACLQVETVEGPAIRFYASHTGLTMEQVAFTIRGDQGVIDWVLDQSPVLRREDGTERRWPARDPDRERQQIMDALARRLEDPGGFVCTLEVAAAQTLCVNGAQESSAILAIPGEHIRHVERDGGEWVEVKGLRTAMRDAMDRGVMLSDTDLPWAHPGSRFDLRGYARFPSNRIGER